MTINVIINGEAGNSVRSKLNQVITVINDGLGANTILNGEGAPNNALGNDGDFYLNTANLNFYGPKVSGVWGSFVVLSGADGEDGKTILSGTEVPDSGLGVNGDFYLRTSTLDFYGPKTGGVWGSFVSLIGSTGATGATGPEGPPGTSINPTGAYNAGTAYAIGDLVSYLGSSYIALASTTGNLPTNVTYWQVVANKGIDGIDGVDGTDGRTILSTTGVPGAEIGVDGDFALDPAASLLYGPKTAGAWGSPVSIKGDPGVNGRTILNGTGIPGAEIGVDGDFYLNTTANDIYGPKTAGAWGIGLSLIGPTGSVSSASTINLAEQGSTPTTPAAGTWELYAKALGIYALDDAGAETLLGASTVAWGDVTGTLADQTDLHAALDAKAPLTPDINAQIGTTYTLVLGDAHGLVTMTNGAANTLTIPTNASVAFPSGTVIEVWQIGAGATTIEAATGVTLNGVSAGEVALGAAYAPATLRKIGTDAWLIAVGGAASVV